MDGYKVFDTTQVADVLFGPDFVIRVRSKFHPKMRALAEFHGKKYRAYTQGFPPEIQDEININWAAMACEDWSGSGAPKDAEGKMLPCTLENAKKVMAADEWLRGDVYVASVSRASFEKQELDDLGKSSAPSSAPTSTTPTAEPKPAA